MTSDRDDLAALIRSTIRAAMAADITFDNAAYISDDDPLDDVTIDGQVDLRGVADAILAAYDVTEKLPPVNAAHLSPGTTITTNSPTLEACGRFISLSRSLMTPEEVAAASAPTPENSSYRRSQMLSAKAEWQMRDDHGRFAPGYIPADYDF